MHYKRPIEPYVPPKRSNRFKAIAIIGTCLAVGLVCGVMMIFGVGDTENTSSKNKNHRFLRWLVGSDAVSKTSKKKFGPFDSAKKRPLKLNFQTKVKVAPPVAKPPSTISFD